MTPLLTGAWGKPTREAIIVRIPFVHQQRLLRNSRAEKRRILGGGADLVVYCHSGEIGLLLPTAQLVPMLRMLESQEPLLPHRIGRPTASVAPARSADLPV
jgi:hypothetical protein